MTLSDEPRPRGIEPPAAATAEESAAADAAATAWQGGKTRAAVLLTGDEALGVLATRDSLTPAAFDELVEELNAERAAAAAKAKPKSSRGSLPRIAGLGALSTLTPTGALADRADELLDDEEPGE